MFHYVCRYHHPECARNKPSYYRLLAETLLAQRDLDGDGAVSLLECVLAGKGSRSFFAGLSQENTTQITAEAKQALEENGLDPASSMAVEEMRILVTVMQEMVAALPVELATASASMETGEGGA